MYDDTFLNFHCLGIVRMVPILDCSPIITLDGVDYKSSVPFKTLFNAIAF